MVRALNEIASEIIWHATMMSYILNQYLDLWRDSRSQTNALLHKACSRWNIIATYTSQNLSRGPVFLGHSIMAFFDEGSLLDTGHYRIIVRRRPKSSTPDNDQLEADRTAIYEHVQNANTLLSELLVLS